MIRFVLFAALLFACGSDRTPQQQVCDAECGDEAVRTYTYKSGSIVCVCENNGVKFIPAEHEVRTKMYRRHDKIFLPHNDFGWYEVPEENDQ